jgi:PAS domain S-box-containing protein
MLLLSGGAFAIRWRNRRMKAGTLKLKVWIVAPTALAMLVGLAIYGAYEYQEFNEESLHRMLNSTEHARGEWNRNVASEVNLLQAQIDHIARNPAMLKAWRNRDLPSLIALAQPAYEQVKRKYRITHFYFMAPDRTIFLRVHQPDRRGDLIDRSTLLTAERTGEDSWGVELGPLGTFTLRYVRPWKQNGKTTGYLELGMEIEHLAGQLARNMNLDIMTVIRKEYTTREKFEAGRQAFGFVGQWDAYRDFVVAHQTTPGLPKEVAHWLEHDHNPATGSEAFNARQGEKRFTCGAIHLPDATGRGVGDLIVMRDVTVEAGAAWSALLLNLGLTIVLLGGLLVLLWSVTGTAERQLGAAFAQLRESEEHLGATLRSIGDGVISTDAAGNVNSLNTVAEALTGWTRAEAQGRPIAEVFHIVNAQTRAEAQNPVHRALAEGRIIGLANHTALIARDGTERKIADSCAPIRSAEGRITGAVLVFRDVTEEYRIGEALRESEERFRILNDNLSVGVAMIGPDMGILAINPRIRQWFPRTDPTGHQPCYDAFNGPPRNEPCTGCPVVKTLRDGQLHVFEREVSTCDGIRVIWITSTAITDRDGNVTAVIEMIDDITERKQAEKELWQKTYDLGERAKELNCLYGISKLVETPNISLNEIIQGVVDSIPPSWQYPEIACSRILMNGNEYRTRNFKETGWKQSGAISIHGEQAGALEVFYLEEMPEIYEGPFLKEERCLIDAVAETLGRVAEHKRAEEALRQSEEKYRTILENIEDGYYEVDLAGNLTFFNDSVCRFLGYSRDELMGVNNPMYTDPENSKKLFQEFNKVYKTGEPVKEFNWEVIREDGTKRFGEVSISLIKDSKGQPIGFRGIARDITERKQAEAEKAEFERQNRQLQKAESLGRMAGAIAHHFNNQLGVVIGNLELAMMELPQGARPRANITSAMKASNKAAEMSGLMLTYLGQSFDKSELLDLSEICRRSLPLLQAVMPGNVALETDLPSPGPAISTNTNYIQQVMTNLITNAREAIGEGRGTINLSVKKVFAANIPAMHRFPLDWQPQDNAYACLEVADEGCGIEDKDIEKLFDPFFSSKFTGRGMGLAVVMGIVRTYKGVVTVESEPGRGSTFRVFLPVSGEEVLRQPEKA